METGTSGFIFPVIDDSKCVSCGLCSQTCPALNIRHDNSDRPHLYAVRAEDEIRKISSSGGMFTVLAEEIISRGGYVCGAAFDNDMELRHVITDSSEGLDEIRGSKYIQSSTGDIYRKVTELLDSGKKVLFTGTPCQVAAVNAVAGDSPYLYTADIICHGVPSQELFNRYLCEKFPDKTVVKAEFRNKEFGWNCEHIRLVFDDSSEYVSDSKHDPYLRAFFRNLSLRDSCCECPFSEFSRQGDITMGDFWGISAIDKKQTDGKGTSIVYVNNEKGEELLAAVSDKLRIKEFDFETTVVKNRIRSGNIINPNRYRFFQFISNKDYTMEASVSRALGGRYDIGIVSNYYAANMGGSLTQYALYNVLEEMGYSCLMIERPADSKGAALPDVLERIYIEPPFRKSAMARQRSTKNEMSELNRNCDAFVVGSDQLFQYSLYNAMEKIAGLDWVRNDKKKIAYAASYGHDFIWGDPKDLADMSFFMRKFDAFSVREESGVKISKESFGVDAEWVLDPVFLCNMKYYDQLISKSQRQLPEHYIASYILDPSEDKAEILKTVQDRLGIKAQIFSEFGNAEKYAEVLVNAGLDVEQLRVEERLQLIKNCDFFVSDSFHGTCFAIIMGKPFIAIINKKRGGSRFESLLSMFGLKERLIYSSEDLEGNTVIFSPVDYSKVNVILERERCRCLKWLSDALKAEKKKESYSDYDVLIGLIREQQEEIRDLKEKLKLITEKVDLGLSSITDVKDYLRKLKKDSETRTVFMSVRDTPGISLSREVADLLNDLGVKSDLKDKHWNSFGCIIEGGNNIFEKLGTERIRKNILLNGNNCWVVSSNYNLDNVSKIIVNKKDFSVNHRGLNIVVWDNEKNTVVDSVCFDMHLKEYECIRK